MRELPIGPFKMANPYAWLWEPLEEDPTFFMRSMFGSKGAYLDGKMMVYFCTKTEPWHGLLVCTEREHHASLMADFSGLAPHSFLGKWLYLPDSNDRFERTAEKIIQAVLRRDPRIGVVPKEKKKKKAKKA